MPRKREFAEIDDRMRVTHMRNAAGDAVFFAKGRSREHLDSDRMLLRALINCVQEIGEAASRMTDEGRKRVSNLPWGQIVGMRHILVHLYDRIDLDAVWSVVVNDLPPLIEATDAALNAWPEPPAPPAPKPSR